MAIEGNEKKEKLENFVNEIVRKNDLQLLDILWDFYYSPCSPNSEVYNEWKKIFGIVCKRNLQKKYDLQGKEAEEKIAAFLVDFVSIFSFSLKEMLSQMLINKSLKILLQNIKDKIENSMLHRKIFSFVSSYILIRISDASKTECDIDIDKHFSINLEEWQYLFNHLFNEKLKEEKLKLPSNIHNILYFIPPTSEKNFRFWQFADELRKLNLGFWKIEVTGALNIYIDFIIPNFIYENIKTYRAYLLSIENFEEKVKQLKRKKKIEEEMKALSYEEIKSIDEKELEELIVSSIEKEKVKVEEGLRLCYRQLPISVGKIDILCQDKYGNYVVIEVKKGKASSEVVGQVQKYIGAFKQSESKQVRGIIIAEDYDKGIEFSIKTSKSIIEPLKYCKKCLITKCLTLNKNSAKYCMECGERLI